MSRLTSHVAGVSGDQSPGAGASVGAQSWARGQLRSGGVSQVRLMSRHLQRGGAVNMQMSPRLLRYTVLFYEIRLQKVAQVTNYSTFNGAVEKKLYTFTNLCRYILYPVPLYKC